MKISKAIEVLKEAIGNDSEYAWGWQCNIAMAAFDEGLDMPASNRAAARFMTLLFGVDMTKHEHFADTQK